MTRRLAVLALMLLTSAALVPPATAGGGCYPTRGGEMRSSADRKVTIAGCAFGHTVTFVEAGDRVTWTNEDAAPHTVTGAALSWGDEDYIDQGDKVTYSFADEGVYPYYCALHPAMVGAVVVGDAEAMLGKGAGNVEKVDLAAAPVGAEDPPASGSSALPLVLTIVVLAAAGAFALRLAVRRRPTPVS